MLEKYDKGNMFDSIWNFSDNLKEALNIGEKINIKNKYSKIQNVVIAGMGGSAIGGDIVSVLEDVNINIPFFVCRDYSIPKWVSKNLWSYAPPILVILKKLSQLFIKLKIKVLIFAELLQVELFLIY